MVVGPTAVLVFSHHDALEIPGAERRLRHCIGQCLRRVLAIAGIAANPGEGEIIPVATLEGEGTFLKALGQTFHHLTTDLHRRHLGHTLTLREFHFLQLAIELQHVSLQLTAPDTHTAPIDISLTVVVDKHTGIDTRYALNGFGL